MRQRKDRSEGRIMSIFVMLVLGEARGTYEQYDSRLRSLHFRYETLEMAELQISVGGEGSTGYMHRKLGFPDFRFDQGRTRRLERR